MPSANEEAPESNLVSKTGSTSDDPRVWIESVTFSDGTQIALGDGDVVAIVGPNNSGKSQALLGLRALLENVTAKHAVVTSVRIGLSGSDEGLRKWLTENSSRPPDEREQVAVRNSGFSIPDALNHWRRATTRGLSFLTQIFSRNLTTEERLGAANPVPSIKMASGEQGHPLHFVFQDSKIEAQLSKKFKEAFGQGLFVNRFGGSEIPLYVGDWPPIEPGEEQISPKYYKKVEARPRLNEQGDGMRCFAGILLHSFTMRLCVLFIDEPEAFLHPPQARLMGRVLGDGPNEPESRQTFIATHSGDVLRGLLESKSKSLRVIRIRRDGDINRVTQLDTTSVSSLWSDAILRFSNVLDGIFHEKVVICEADPDCRFYNAVLDAVWDGSGTQRPDLMFTHGGGKHRLPVIQKALLALGVPTVVVADFDVLNEEQPLKALVENAGGDWLREFEPRWIRLKKAIDQKKSELTRPEVRIAMMDILDASTEPSLSKQERDKLRSLTKQSTPWGYAKSMGLNFVPPGEPHQNALELLRLLEQKGVLVVPGGEMESFARSIPGGKQRWVNVAIARDLKSEQEFAAAREFVAKFR